MSISIVVALKKLGTGDFNFSFCPHLWLERRQDFDCVSQMKLNY